MAETVYLLCALTSAICALMLVRGFWKSRVRLLLWSSMCFLGLAANNIMLFLDLVIFPGVDLSIWRGLAAVSGMVVLLGGLIWEAA